MTMLKRLALLTVALALTLGARSAMAKTVAESATITGTASVVTGLGTGGACEASGYSAICPSGVCTCIKVIGAKMTGSLAGKGTVDMEITLDDNSATSSPGCNPLFGIVTISGTVRKIPVSADANFAGVTCMPLVHATKASISGGFGTTSISLATSAYGTVNGTEDSSGNVKLTLKAAVTF